MWGERVVSVCIGRELQRCGLVVDVMTSRRGLTFVAGELTQGV